MDIVLHAVSLYWYMCMPHYNIAFTNYDNLHYNRISKAPSHATTT